MNSGRESEGRWAMWGKKISGLFDARTIEFRMLLQYVNELATNKLGYPVSLLTYIGAVDNKILGIKPGSLANVLLNNVGDPFKDSETSLMEVKKHERRLIAILERFYGLPTGKARGYVTTGGTEGNFASLWWSKRYLVNCCLDTLIANDNKTKLLLKEEQAMNAALAKIPTNDFEARATALQKLLDTKNEISNSKNKAMEILTPTVFYTKNHTHYSIPKISEILHLNIRPVASNPDGSMDLKAFRKELLLNASAHPLSPIIAVANIGTTITGAIDDVPGMKKIIDELNPKPAFTIHMDGALTGFVLPIIKPFGDITNYFDELGVNTLAFSAHKYAGLSQPCGVILSRKEFFDKAFDNGERSVDYVGNINDVTITGSRSGLNVLMFYNALYALGLNKDNTILEKMVAENIATAKYLYQELVKVYGNKSIRNHYHFNVSLPKPSMAIAKKYQLMLTGDRATICVLSNVTRKLIDQFIQDLVSEGHPLTNEGDQYECKEARV